MSDAPELAEHHREAGRHRHLGRVHRRDHRDLADLPGIPHHRAAGRPDRVRRRRPPVRHRHAGPRPTADHHREQAAGRRRRRVPRQGAIAAILLALRDTTGVRPHCHFEWSEGSPLGRLFRYLILGQGDTPPVVREILRKAEENPTHRPGIHVGG